MTKRVLSFVHLGLMLGFVFASAQAAPPRKTVGWVLDPYFVERDVGQDSPAVSHDFYPKGETPTAWTERILLRSQIIAPGTTPTALLDHMVEAFRKECPSMSEKRIPVAGEDAANQGLSMWHCHDNPLSHRGQVLVQKVLVGAGHAYVMTAEGSYLPFDEGKTALTHGQLDRWSTTLASLVLCTDMTFRGCLPDANLVMKATTAELTPSQIEAVHLAETRGRELYRQDQLAWHATDFLMRSGGIKKSDAGGFIAVPGDGESGTVYFFQRSGARIVGVTQVSIDARGQPVDQKELESLPGDVGSREEALQVARASGPSTCSQTVSNAILRAEDGNGWWVYVLTGTKEPNLMFLGGHTRMHVGRDGKLLAKEPSAKSCLALKTDDRAPHGGTFGPPVMTHLMSDVPWETHVLQSLTFNKALIVVTSNAVWRVENGHIVRLDL